LIQGIVLRIGVEFYRLKTRQCLSKEKIIKDKGEGNYHRHEKNDNDSKNEKSLCNLLEITLFFFVAR